jgi:hypothetical protein
VSDNIANTGDLEGVSVSCLLVRSIAAVMVPAAVVERAAAEFAMVEFGPDWFDALAKHIAHSPSKNIGAGFSGAAATRRTCGARQFSFDVY